MIKNTSIVINTLAIALVLSGCVGFLTSLSTWVLPLAVGCFLVLINQILNWLMS